MYESLTWGGHGLLTGKSVFFLEFMFKEFSERLLAVSGMGRDVAGETYYSILPASDMAPRPLF